MNRELKKTKPADDPIGLEGLLHYRVQRLASKMSLITTRDVLAGSGVHIGEWRLICLLAENGPLKHAAISQKLALDRGRTSRLLQAAEKKRLVKRTSNPLDGRSSFFQLTDGSVDIIERLWPVAGAVADDFHKLYTDAELELLNRLLDRAITYSNARVAASK